MLSATVSPNKGEKKYIHTYTHTQIHIYLNVLMCAISGQNFGLSAQFAGPAGLLVDPVDQGSRTDLW